MTAHVVVTDYTFPDVSMERHAAAESGASFADFQCRNAADVTARVAGAKVVAVQFAPVTAAAISSLADAATIIRYGIGYDNIDLKAARASGVRVGYVPDYCTDEVAEHTCAAALALLRKLPALDASVRAGAWKPAEIAQPMKPMAEVRFGFFGFGQIGRAVHARLKGFGFAFQAVDPALTSEAAADLGIALVDPETLFVECDVVSLHAPSTPSTHHFVNAERLASMKSHAVLINCARGSLVDEEALAAALTAHSIGGAALDVFSTEPLPATSPLRDAPNLMLSPHAAWYSDAAIERLQRYVADDIRRALEGLAPRRPVPDP